MKTEVLRLSPLDKVDLSKVKKVDSENWNYEKWKSEKHIDYIEAIKLLNSVSIEFKETVYKAFYDVTRIYLPEILYKYYQLDENEALNHLKLGTLEKQEVYLSNLGESNDPFDGRVAVYSIEELKEYVKDDNFNGVLFDDFSDFHIGASLTEVGAQNMPMWNAYSRNHQGYCVSYKTVNNPSIMNFAFPIQYVDNRVDITDYLINFLSYINLERKKQLGLKPGTVLIYDKTIPYILILLNFLKSTVWAHEKEFRISVSDRKIDHLSLVPHEIFIGRNCTKENIHKIVEIGKSLNVPVFKMSKISERGFELETELIYNPK